MATIVTGVVGVARSKVGAVFLGPAGVGIVTQLNSVSILAGSVAAAGLSLAATKLIAEAREAGDNIRVRRVSTFVLAVPFMTGCLLLAVSVPLRQGMASLFLGSDKHPAYLLYALASVPLNLLVGSAMAVLQGHQRIVSIARFTALNACLSAVVMVVLISTAGLQGAVVGILLTSALSIGLVLLLEPWLRRLPTRTWRLDRSSRRLMFGLGAAGLVVGVLEVAVEVVLRTAMVQRFGVATNGMFQPVSLLALQLFLPVTVGVTAFLVPRLSALQGTERVSEATQQLERAVRLVILSITPIALLLVATRTLYIRLVFSPHFSAAGNALLVQAPGQVVQAAAYVLGAVLVPAGRVRAWFAVATTVYLSQMVVGFVMLHWLRLTALPIAFDVAWTLALVLTVRLLRDAEGRTWPSLGSAPLTLVVAGISVVACAAAICVIAPPLLADPLAAAAAFAWVRWATTSSERSRMRREVHHRLRSFRQWGRFP